jgi:hypothetical protein
MATIQREWDDGDILTIRYEAEEEGIGYATFLPDANEGTDREMTIAFKGESEGVTVSEERKVVQEGKRKAFGGLDGTFHDANGDRFLGLKQKYKEQ